MLTESLSTALALGWLACAQAAAAAGADRCSAEEADPRPERAETGLDVDGEATQAQHWISDVVIGAKIGGAYRFMDTRLDDLGIVTLAFDLRLESEAFFLELGAGVRLGSMLNSWPPNPTTDAGISFYLTEAVHAPYVGLGVVAKLEAGHEPPANIAPYAQLGLMFFRTNPTRLFIDLRASHYAFIHKPEIGRYFRLTELGLAVGLGR